MSLYAPPTTAPPHEALAAGAASPERRLRVGSRSYPVVLPSIRDARLHLAAVIITIHVLGQVALDFAVSAPQILVAILVSALIEVVWIFVREQRLVWPASAMLTGSGIALIFRVIGTEHGDYWATGDVALFAAVSAGAMLSKYAIRYGGTHLLNPSNVALVAAFVLLGSNRVEPLDFWWAPLSPWMALAYGVILIGGVLITSRLALLAMGAAFWLALAAGLGVLAASGHCMTARWSVDPVCDGDFWWVVVSSPETLIFLFFMITDPRTIPVAPRSRVAFAVGVALVSTLLIAPATDEFGAKVGLLAGLVLLCALRPAFDRFGPPVAADAEAAPPVPEARAPRHRSRAFLLLAAPAVALAAGAIVLAGSPARSAVDVPGEGEIMDLAELPAIEPFTMPSPTLGDGQVILGNPTQAEADAIAAVLGQNLAIESEALRRGEAGWLSAVNHGNRLFRLLDVVAAGQDGTEVRVATYHVDELELIAVWLGNMQTTASHGFKASGTVEYEFVDYRTGAVRDGGSHELAVTFAMGRSWEGRWFVLDTPSTDGD